MHNEQNGQHSRVDCNLPMPGVLNEPTLLLDKLLCALGRVLRSRPEHSRELAEPVRFGVLFERVHLRLHRVRHRRHVAALARSAAALPQADELVELLLSAVTIESASRAREGAVGRPTSSERSLINSSTRGLDLADIGN
jgi:hypothetical protein